MWQILCPLVWLLAADPENRPLALDDLQPAPAVSVADLVAGYRMNAALFKRSRVTWCYIKHRLPAWYDTERLFAQHIRQNGGTQPTLDETNMLKVCWRWRDYWTDGKNAQLRTPATECLNRAEGRKWHFSDDPVTPESLTTTYKNYSIWSVTSKSGFRHWFGETPRVAFARWRGGPDIKYEGSVSDQIKSLAWAMTYPPLLAPETPDPAAETFDDDDAGTIHPIDRFFRASQKEARVLGSIQLDGARVYVLEQRTEEEPWEGAKEKDGIISAGVTRAFVDPARGYLPLRIEYGCVRVHNGKDFDAQPVVGRVITCTRLQQIPGGGFYPTRGTCQDFGADPTDPVFSAELDDQVYYSGKAKLEKKTKLIDGQWVITRVVANPAMPDKMFALEFPTGTLYLDMAAGQRHLVGTPDDALTQP